MASKPCQRSLKHLRDNGWTVAVVEKWIPPRGTMKFGVRQDVWGFGDLLACKPAEPGSLQLDWIRDLEAKGFNLGRPATIALVQTTDHSSFAKHKEKILTIPEFEDWKRAGGLVLLHGWGKRGPRGKRKVWTLREEML